MKTREEVIEFIEKPEFEINKDWGLTPAKDKKVLLKGGAERILDFAECEAVTTVVDRQMNLEKLFYHCEARTDVFVMGGNGEAKEPIASHHAACNTWERRYRYRLAKSKCPECGSDAPMVSKKTPGMMWCNVYRAGCGKEYPRPADVQDKLPNSDAFEAINTVVRMAQKRSYVAAVQQAFKLSSYFASDIDEDDDSTEGDNKAKTPAKSSDVKKPDLKPPKQTTVVAPGRSPLKFLSGEIEEDDVHAFEHASRLNGWEASMDNCRDRESLSHELVRLCATAADGTSVNALTVKKIFQKYCGEGGISPLALLEMFAQSVPNEYPSIAALLKETSRSWLED